MIPRTAEDAADWLRARQAQAAQARRQAEHHRRLAEIWDAQAAEFEADITLNCRLCGDLRQTLVSAE